MLRPFFDAPWRPPSPRLRTRSGAARATVGKARLLLAGVAMALLAGCGIKGPLKPPTAAPAAAVPAPVPLAPLVPSTAPSAPPIDPVVVPGAPRS